MRRYLTSKAEKCALWEVPAGLLSALMTSVVLQVFAEDVAAGLSDPVIDLLAHLTVLVMALLPLYFVARRALDRRAARKLARALARRTEARLPLAQLDAVTGTRHAAARIAKLCDKCYLRRLEIDRDAGTLCLDNPEAAAPQPAAGDASDQVLQRIRALNDAIDDAGVSRRIERIEALTASIFETVRRRPERADDARRFVNYYLPVTLKLLESYNLMEDQSYQGQTIQTSREQIEAALEKLVFAIEQQQDRLLRPEAMDVEAEIRVLETMMRSDGTAGE